MVGTRSNGAHSGRTFLQLAGINSTPWISTAAPWRLFGLEEDVWMSFFCVVDLNLSSNGLQLLPPGVFKGLTRVVKMDPSSNALTYLQPDVHPKSLRKLCLSNNFIFAPEPERSGLSATSTSVQTAFTATWTWGASWPGWTRPMSLSSAPQRC